MFLSYLHSHPNLNTEKNPNTNRKYLLSRAHPPHPQMTSTLGASASIMFEREKSAIVHQFKSFQNVLKEVSQG